jgi:RNA recognition motif-containing protein
MQQRQQSPQQQQQQQFFDAARGSGAAGNLSPMQGPMQPTAQAGMAGLYDPAYDLAAASGAASAGATASSRRSPMTISTPAYLFSAANSASGGSPTASESSVFVAGLPPEVNEETLRAAFGGNERYPSMLSVRVVFDANTGVSKGFGFVRFGNTADQNRAVLEMNGYALPTGHRLRVIHAVAKPPTPNPAQGGAGSPSNAGGGGGSYGSANIGYPYPQGGSTPSATEQPFGAPTGGRPHAASSLSEGSANGAGMHSNPGLGMGSINTSPGASSHAPKLGELFAPPPHPSEGQTTLFVGALHATVTEPQLFLLFNEVGPVSAVKIPRDKSTGRGCGFVQYRYRADAESALTMLQGALLGSLRIRLAWGKNQLGARTPLPLQHSLEALGKTTALKEAAAVAMEPSGLMPLPPPHNAGFAPHNGYGHGFQQQPQPFMQQHPQQGYAQPDFGGSGTGYGASTFYRGGPNPHAYQQQQQYLQQTRGYGAQDPSAMGGGGYGFGHQNRGGAARRAPAAPSAGGFDYPVQGMHGGRAADTAALGFGAGSHAGMSAGMGMQQQGGGMSGFDSNRNALMSRGYVPHAQPQQGPGNFRPNGHTFLEPNGFDREQDGTVLASLNLGGTAIPNASRLPATDDQIFGRLGLGDRSWGTGF